MSNSAPSNQDIKPAFQFVDLSNPDNANDPATRRVIRQQAMRDVGLSRRRPRKKRGVTDVPINDSILESITSHAGTSQDLQYQPEISPYQLLGGGEIDPFLPYPIPLDNSTRELVANIFRNDGGEGILRAHRDEWFAVGLSDPLPFHLVLSNAALGFDYLRTRNQDIVNVPWKGQRALKHFVIALRGMKERLNEEPFRESDAAIGAVVGFMCHDIFGDRVENWLQHREGITTMLSLRGGVDAINSNKQLRVSVSWVDLRGAYVYDQRPQFSMPPSAWGCAIEPAEFHDRPSSANTIMKALRRRAGQSSAFTDILADLIDVSIATGLLLGEQGSAHWTTRTDGGGWTQNIIHRLLSWRPLIEAFDDDYLNPDAQEACRLATLLYIAPIWRKYGAAPVVTTVLVQKLLTQIQLAPTEWGELGLLRLWVLAVGGLEAENYHVFRQLTNMLASHLRDRHVLSWEQIFPSLKAFLWMEDALGEASERLSGELDRLLLNGYH